MPVVTEKEIRAEFESFIGDKIFPCIGAKAALAKGRLYCLVVDHLACGKDDGKILDFLYKFIDQHRGHQEGLHSAAILFKNPGQISEDQFETFFWQRLQALSDMDALQYSNDRRVSPDIESPNYSFSLKEEGFFLLGMHPGSSRLARRFRFPAIVFNPHEQFEQLKASQKYESMKAVVRKRDILFSGSVNPMLQDHGTVSEIRQYSGKDYGNSMQCPFKNNHGSN